MTILISPLVNHLVIQCLMQVILDRLLAEGQHVLHALVDQLPHAYTLVLRVVQLMLRDELDYIALVLSHAVEDEAEADLLVVILEGEEGRLVLQLAVEVLEGVDLQGYKVEAVQHLLTPHHPRLYVVH